MLLKLLGITVATGKDREFVNPPISMATGLSTQNNVVASLPEASKEKRTEKFNSMDFADLLHPLTKAIKWPEPGDNVWRKTILRDNIMKFNDSAKRGYFNICPFSDLKEKCNLILTEEGEFAYRRLRSIHCIDFSMMDEEVLQSISTLANVFFSTRKLNDNNVLDFKF